MDQRCLFVDLLLCPTEQWASLGPISIFEVSDSADKLKHFKRKPNIMDTNMNNSVTGMTRSKQKTATAAPFFNKMHEMTKSCQRLLNCHGLQTRVLVVTLVQSTHFTGRQRCSIRKISLTFILCGLYSVPGYS